VRRAGATPIALPPGDPAPEHYLGLIDGLILTGGGDIEPDAYGGEAHDALYSMCSERDMFELRLAREVLKREDFPLLSICRGMQILNVACGGDLYPHIPDAIESTVAHRKPRQKPTDHRATVDPRSRLAAILGETDLTVRSWHHQAVREIGTNLRAVAWAEDGIVEAVEHDAHSWCIAVQWHPELQPDDPVQQRLFSAFVARVVRGNTGEF
jgi:putative glutamine amidotransferase